MGAGIIRVAKVKAPQLGGLQHHIDREGKNHSNPDIDVSRSDHNRNWVGHGNYEDFVAQRIAEGRESTRAVRKDAVVLVDGIVTLPEDDYKRLGNKQTAQYLRDARDFVMREFGEENLAYFTVHLDETVPHAHWGAVPLKDGSLSWKNYFGSKYALSAFQDRFFEQVSSRYGLERGQKRQDGENVKRHKSVSEKKKETERELARAEEKLDETNQERIAAQEDLSRVLAQIEQAKGDLAAIEEQKSAEEAESQRIRLSWIRESERLEHLQRYADGVGERVEQLQSVVADVREFEAAGRSGKSEILNRITERCDKIRNGMVAARDGVVRRLCGAGELVRQLRVQLQQRDGVPRLGMSRSVPAQKQHRQESFRESLDRARAAAAAMNRSGHSRGYSPGRGR